MTVTITLTISGSNTGPFELYSDLDGYVTPFESGVARLDLIAGYTTALVPDWTNTIKIVSTGVCTNSIFVSVVPYTTTTSTSTSTTTSTSTSTTTTTTTAYQFGCTDFGVAFSNYQPGSQNLWEAGIYLPANAVEYTVFEIYFTATRNDEPDSYYGTINIPVLAGTDSGTATSLAGLAQDFAEQWTVDTWEITGVLPDNGYYIVISCPTTTTTTSIAP